MFAIRTHERGFDRFMGPVKDVLGKRGGGSKFSMPCYILFSMENLRGARVIKFT